MIDKLQELGLSYYESKAMESILKNPLTAKEVSRTANIPLGKVYSTLLSLERKNLISSTDSRPQKFYIDNASESIDSLINLKQNEHEKLLNDIRSFATEMDIVRKKPPKFFQLGTNQDDDKVMQMRSFMEAEKEVCQVLNAHHRPEYDRKNKTLWENEIVKATERGVKFRSIYHPLAKVPAILDKLNKKYPDRFMIKRLDKYFTRCDIIDGKKVLLKVTYDDPSILGLVFIENEKFAKKMQDIFETLWDEAS